MKLGGICITTNNVPRLAEFYKVVFEEEPFVEGDHYSFSKIAVLNPGDVAVSKEKNIWLQCFVADLGAEYERLMRKIPNLNVIAPPERKPWGAYSFWFADLDGNKIAVAQVREEGADE